MLSANLFPATAPPGAAVLVLTASNLAAEGFQVRKNSLRESIVTDTTAVDQAASWAKRLTLSEAKGPGDMENAWRRLEHRYGVPWRAFWSLRYRRPNEIAASIYLRLQAAYAAECERQIRRHQHELELTRAQAGVDCPAVVAAEALVGEGKSKDK